MKLLLPVLVAAVLSALPAAAQEDGPIRVAIEGAYPPFNYIENDDLKGFEPDLLAALCAAMKARCIPVQRAWDGIVRGLLNREYDAIMSSLEITERRLKRIAFSKAYYRMPEAFIAPRESALSGVSPEALKGLRIGAVDRSEHAALIEDLYKGSTLSLYGKLEEANLDLLTDRLDVVIADKLSLTRFLDSREGRCCRLVGDVPYNPVYHGLGYGIGLRPSDTALKARFDEALDAIIADGTYDRIRARYFPFDIKM